MKDMRVEVLVDNTSDIGEQSIRRHMAYDGATMTGITISLSRKFV